MVEFGLWEIVATVIALVAATAISFYVKDWVERRLQYKSLKKKVENIAGKGAAVIHDGRMFKIESIESDGITLRGKIQTVFIPIANVLKNEIILPVENYEDAKKEMMKKDLEDMSEVVIPMLRDKMMPALIDGVKDHIVGKLEPGGELDAIVGLRVRKALEDEGLGIKRLEGRSEEDR